VTEIRDWVVFSSSSGETLQELWRRLPDSAKDKCQGIFCDRSCGSSDVASRLLAPEKVFAFSKSDFEIRFLETAKKLKNDSLILLVGFFGILSAKFLQECGFPIVNTHPSLLPAFSGLDKKVHREAFKDVCITGFTIHLVSEVVDGGTILFQHPVWVDSSLDWESSRNAVRKREQALLPIIWEKILLSDLKKEDLSLTSSQLRTRLKLNLAYFDESKGIL
jgi:folate-dependent phosphoribosylglycinamide formyltransferase PurN